MASLESTQSQAKQQIRMLIKNSKSVIHVAALDFLQIMRRIALPFVRENFKQGYQCETLPCGRQIFKKFSNSEPGFKQLDHLIGTFA